MVADAHAVSNGPVQPEIRVARWPGVLGAMIAARERQILEALHDVPGVIRVVGAGDAEGSMAVWPARTVPLSSRWDAPVLDVLGGLLGTLDVLHRRGVVHGALSPEAVRLHGDTVVVDGFAVAAARALGVEAPHALEVLAPECAAGAPPTPAADLYAVGCLAFGLATGDLPYRRLLPSALVRAHRLAPMPPVVPQAGRVLPAAFVGWVARLLSKRPEERFGSARAAAALLDPARCAA